MAPRRETSARPVTEGVWAFSSPRPAGGDAARLYALSTSDGVYLVDAGWQSDDSYALLVEGLRAAGLDYDDVKGLALTHLHPDHCGLASRIREETGAWIAAHPREAASAAHRHGADAPFLEQLRSWLPRAGAPPSEGERLVGARRTIGDSAPVPPIDIPLSDGATLELGERVLTAVLTPGHSPGHLCFLDAERRLLFAGDVVLPHRLPPVGAFSFDAASDPVATFLASLERVEQLEATLVLPGHGEPFDDVSAETARIRTHHERRIALVREFVRAAPATVWEATLAAPWRSPWSDLPAFAQLLGLGKVNAHLLALCNRGLAELHDGAPVTFAAAGAS